MDLSFVVTARNDDYGKKFLYRTQLFLDNLIYLCEKYKLDSELIIVEWNPPKDKKRLYRVLQIPKKRKYLAIRFIEVPNKIHKKQKDSEKMPLFEYIGKNVGIRRAKGKFVLATNPDILFSEELIKFFSANELRTDCFYRISRSDILQEVPSNLNFEERLEYCKKNKYINRMVFKGFSLKDITGSYKEDFKNVLKFIAYAGASLLFPKKYSYILIHEGAPGDFMLMYGENWKKLLGYPELPISGVIDAYNIIMAKSFGLKMTVFKKPLRIYHQDHGRDDQKKRPRGNPEKYLRNVRYMLNNKKLIKFNDSNWGLKKEKLKEIQA